jgi:hypothetical protein
MLVASGLKSVYTVHDNFCRLARELYKTAYNYNLCKQQKLILPYVHEYIRTIRHILRPYAVWNCRHIQTFVFVMRTFKYNHSKNSINYIF